MHLRTRTWVVLSLLCFLAAAIFWQLAERKASRDKAAREKATREKAAALTNAPTVPSPVGSQPRQPSPAVTGAISTNAAHNPSNESFPLRLSNTPKSLDELSRSDQAILLRNALIDSSAPVTAGEG